MCEGRGGDGNDRGRGCGEGLAGHVVGYRLRCRVQFQGAVHRQGVGCCHCDNRLGAGGGYGLSSGRADNRGHGG